MTTLYKPDPRVEKALKKLGMEYEIDEEGRFGLSVGFDDGRTQAVLIDSKTERLDEMEIRKVWSIVTEFSHEPPPKLSPFLLERNATLEIGSYQYSGGSSGEYYLIFCVPLSANASADELGLVLYYVAAVADQTEEEIIQSDDY